MKDKHDLKNTHEIIEKTVFSNREWQENLTILDLSNRDIWNFDLNVTLPENLTVLNLANNKLQVVPETVSKLDKLKTLDLSLNKIELFDKTPNFCHSIKTLNLKSNNLIGPPRWIWSENPKNLVQLNLSCNINICKIFDNHYFEELLQYTTLVKRIDLHSCSLGKHLKLLSTFKHAQVVNLGNDDYNYLAVNHIENVPCVGLEDCKEIEALNLCNTHIYSVEHNIDLYQCLKVLNLSQNNLNSLPNEFCNLANLEVCILSFNKILYLPEDIHKLVRLNILDLNNNELCMLPETLSQLNSLKKLDLYQNHLYEGASNIKCLEEYDFGQNYNDEPDDEEYLKKKAWLRRNYNDRLDGRAPEIVHEESERSTDNDSMQFSSDDDVAHEESQKAEESRCSSPEDWDSDDFWIPSSLQTNQCTPRHYQASSTSPTAMKWLEYVKRKMAEGNFCPMDMHLSISITEKVKYEKMYNPKPHYESDGQFDDYSDDDS